MEVRGKLVELLCKCTPKNTKVELRGAKIDVSISQGKIADYLIANGVTVQPIKIGDTVYGRFDHRGKEIHECKVVKVKVCQFRDKSFHCFLDVEFDIIDPYYRDGRLMHCMQDATYGEDFGSWYRVYASREEAEAHLPQPPKGELL